MGPIGRFSSNGQRLAVDPCGRAPAFPPRCGRLSTAPAGARAKAPLTSPGRML